MRTARERLLPGDLVDLPRQERRAVVLEVLGRERVRVFRDGALQMDEVNRYALRLDCGRTVVVSDRGAPLVRSTATTPELRAARLVATPATTPAPVRAAHRPWR